MVRPAPPPAEAAEHDADKSVEVQPNGTETGNSEDVDAVAQPTQKVISRKEAMAVGWDVWDVWGVGWEELMCLCPYSLRNKLKSTSWWRRRTNGSSCSKYVSGYGPAPLARVLTNVAAAGQPGTAEAADRTDGRRKHQRGRQSGHQGQVARGLQAD